MAMGKLELAFLVGMLAAAVPAVAAATAVPDIAATIHPSACVPSVVSAALLTSCSPSPPTAACCEFLMGFACICGPVPFLCRVRRVHHVVYAGFSPATLIMQYSSCSSLLPTGVDVVTTCEQPSCPCMRCSP